MGLTKAVSNCTDFQNKFIIACLSAYMMGYSVKNQSPMTHVHETASSRFWNERFTPKTSEFKRTSPCTDISSFSNELPSPESSRSPKPKLSLGSLMPLKSRFYKNTTLSNPGRKQGEGVMPMRYKSSENLFNKRPLRSSDPASFRTSHDFSRKRDATGFQSSQLLSTSQPDLRLKKLSVTQPDMEYEATTYEVDTDLSKYNTKISSNTRRRFDSLKDFSDCQSSTIKPTIFGENHLTDFSEINGDRQKLNSNRDRLSGFEAHELSDGYYDSRPTSRVEDDDKGIRSRDQTYHTIIEDDSNSSAIRDVNQNTLKDVQSGRDGKPVVVNRLESKTVLDGDQVIFACRIIGTYAGQILFI